MANSYNNMLTVRLKQPVLCKPFSDAFIAAIKALRLATGCGLVDGKQAIERLHDDPHVAITFAVSPDINTSYVEHNANILRELGYIVETPQDTIRSLFNALTTQALAGNDFDLANDIINVMKKHFK